jgi:hypothetical protein
LVVPLQGTVIGNTKYQNEQRSTTLGSASLATQSTPSMRTTLKQSTVNSTYLNATRKSMEPTNNVSNAAPATIQSATFASKLNNETSTTPWAANISHTLSKFASGSIETTISIKNSSTISTTSTTSNVNLV